MNDAVTIDDVLIRVVRGVGRITLNRPKALNALTHEMVVKVDATLRAWAADQAVKLVLVDGAGERGLCAGGDIRSLYDAVVEGDMSGPRAFFAAEYRMNAHIAAFPKPYVAFMDGIVMGGGIGISAHGTHRVVTERSRLAMPETGIGFMPDVGGTWILSQAPDQIGTHVGLAAVQIGAADAMLCGLADTHVPSASLADLAEALVGCSDAASVSACIDGFATPPAPGVLEASRGWIAECYLWDDMEQIAASLAANPDPGAQAALAELAKKSPTSLKVTLRALREAPRMGSLNAALEQEYRLVLAVMARPDFREGVRAAVVDKDRNPHWSPASLAEVQAGTVDAMFAAAGYGGIGLSA